MAPAHVQGVRRLSAREREAAVLDVSNLLWTFSRPSIGIPPDMERLHPVVRALRAAGVRTIVGVADANVTSLLGEGGLDTVAEGLFDRFEVVQTGTPADTRILEIARRAPAFVVSNDRFREWKRRDRWVKRNIHRLLMTAVPDESCAGGVRLGFALPSEE